jgi:hypothetical protein
MGWGYYEFPVMASNPVTRLEFISKTDGFYGPALYDVAVKTTQPVPIRASGLLIGLAFSMFLVIKARLKKFIG